MRDINFEKLVGLRKELHQYPELSGYEIETSKRIIQFLKLNNPTKIIDSIGGSGLAAIYDFGESGKTITIRCELDALPIQEINQFSHRSTTNGVSHKCGHDGHMAILSGVSSWLKNQKFQKGKVVLLFQPAEENGEGAYKVLNNQRFIELKIDYFFSLHNLPKEPMHSIVMNDAGFSAEVQSFSILLNGKESHAAEPENGINPAMAMAKIINELSATEIADTSRNDFTIMTPVHFLMGQKSYGISPALAELHYTLRTWTNAKMIELQQKIEDVVAAVSKDYDLEYKINWFEYFPATVNYPETNEYVYEAIKQNDFQLVNKSNPMKFGEDFGWYSKTYKTTMFGLGAGLDTSALHNADYDFPDEIIETGVKMFTSIISGILK
ncbi:amidohydrolase [Algoriella xinjiangensis]|uniref:Amidohydrolase n=1 Tax=Algoriella xinjiangensis TaxID=684065 RepID=A0A1I4W9D1_9FLAO|nr:amidohydrolase [Algoriella xinjiangensis]SFN10311.1 amidohydrolase [Algoriella xinjiangensis]VDH15424.1 Uncharacterized hydrolase YxeP [Algoriella xinjiangensis]